MTGAKQGNSNAVLDGPLSFWNEVFVSVGQKTLENMHSIAL